MAIKPIQRNILLGLTLLVVLNGTGFFALAWLQTGYHRIFEADKQAALSKIQLKMDKNEFSTIAWIGSNDFAWKGKVYDCSSITVHHSLISITCTCDQEETSLRNSLSDNFDQQKDSSTAPKPAKIKLLVFPVFPVISNSSIPPLSSGDTIAFQDYRQSVPAAPSLSLLIPPPEQA
jgi:hypothetical protein